MKKLCFILSILFCNLIYCQSSGDSILISSELKTFVSPDDISVDIYEDTYLKTGGGQIRYCKWSGNNGGQIRCDGGICVVIFTPGLMGQCIVCVGGPFNGTVICGPITGPGPGGSGPPE